MIFHVTTRDSWAQFEGDSYYHPETYKKEGFIHCCTPEQLAGVLQRYFSDQQDLLLLHLDEKRLSAPVRYETATNNELFPHVYGPINKWAIIKVEKLSN